MFVNKSYLFFSSGDLVVGVDFLINILFQCNLHKKCYTKIKMLMFCRQTKPQMFYVQKISKHKV